MSTVKDKADFKVLLVYPNLPLMLVPSLAVAILTGILKGQGYRVELFETTGYLPEDSSSPENRVKFSQARQFDYERDLGVKPRRSDMNADFRAKVQDFAPDLICYSVVEDAFRQAVGLMEAVADLGIPHLLGGVFPTSAPEACFTYPIVRQIALGEGEEVVVAVAEAVRQNQPTDAIPGTWMRKEDGTIIRNPRPPLVDIDRYRPDFSLFDERRFYRPMGGRIFRTVPIETYRGCPYTCTFCNSPMQVSLAKDENLGKFLRRKSLPRLRDELRQLIELYNPEFFYFIDDSFLARPKSEIFAFCDMYEEFRLPFWFNTRPESCTPDVLARLKEIGAYRISFGIESGNETFRRTQLLRYNHDQQIIKSFQDIADSGIAFSVNLIIGFPGETRELVMDTVEMVRHISGFDSLTVSIFTPYHGTRLRTVAVENGWLEADTITVHTTSRSLLKMPPPYLSADDIDGLMRVLPLYCYFPKSEWARIRLAEINDDAGNAILAEYQKIYHDEFLGLTQDEKLKRRVEGGTGCRASPRDTLLV